MAHGQEKEWNIAFYRLVGDRWQRLVARNRQKRRVALKASARKGCIVMRRIQTRLRLEEQQVTRRHNCILVCSGGAKRRVALLQFRSVADCNARNLSSTR